MQPLEIGQVLSLRLCFNNRGDISAQKHPCLIVDINDLLGYVEVAQFSSLKGKEYKAAFRSNKVVLNSDPVEMVIDCDSYIQMDNKFMLENYIGLIKFRRQTEKLSAMKLVSVLLEYKSYQQKNELEEDKQVYMTKDEIERHNA